MKKIEEEIILVDRDLILNLPDSSLSKWASFPLMYPWENGKNQRDVTWGKWPKMVKKHR